MRALYEGRFVPGQRLIAPELMSEFNVGRGTIREVLNRLTASGVVSIVQNRGAQVRRLSRLEILDLLDIVELMLGLAARGAASAIDASASRAELLAHDERLRSQGADDMLTNFLQARDEYYRCIVKLSGNHELRRLFPAAQVHIMRLQLRPFQNAADSTNLDDYSGLTDAILSGNPEEAEAAGRLHVVFTRRRVFHLPDRAFKPHPS
jgi:DNA-binding GntR family transcriptional regulator